MPREKSEVVRFDAETRKWFDKLPIPTRMIIQTTVTQCEKCGLWYKPSLGHKCKKKGD